MKKFVCTVCGYVHEGEKPPKECPVCHQPASKFREEKAEKKDTGSKKTVKKTEKKKEKQDLSYDSDFYRVDESCRYMEEIHQMAVSGKSISGAMGTTMPMPSWDAK